MLTTFGLGKAAKPLRQTEKGMNKMMKQTTKLAKSFKRRKTKR